MKKVSRRGLMGYVVALIISLFIVLFVGNKYVAETGTSHVILTPQGITHFKKGLDLAGGVRLTYKIDFSKYEETYSSSPSQLLQVKKTAQDIILKNIDKRISTLGVSDYNAYVQKLSDGEYVVVEIGGVQDLESAKKLIGKTVELEFKVPNEAKENDPAVYAERQKLAEGLFADVVKNPSSMKDIASSKGSQDVSYNSYTEATLDKLPMIYRNNIAKFTNISTGSVYPTLFTGLYHMSISSSETGGLTAESLKGFTIVKFNSKKDIALDEIPLGDILSYATKNKLDAKRAILHTFDGKTQMVRYDAASNSVIYVGEQDLPKQDGYNVSIYEVDSGVNVDTVVASVQNGETSTLQKLVEGWKTAQDITTIVPSFKYEEGKKIYSYKELDATYVIAVHEVKKESDTVYPQVTIKVKDAIQGNAIVESLKHKVLYSFDDIFVSDSLRWLPAKDPKSNTILNGAYFKYASVSQSQTGKPVVSIQFDDQGKDIFCNLTEQYVNKQMAIFVGGQLTTAPVIRDKICGGSAQIDGSFDIKGARELADNLNSGALPAPLLLSHEETIAPSLGQNALNGALRAGLIGIIIVYGVMLLLYGWKKANIVLIGIASFLIFLLAIIKVLGIVSSLSGIGAVILSLGMAVDANVLIYERIREELEAGKTSMNAIEDGYERSLPPIRDGNVTTGIIGLLLFLVGVNIFKGFGTMMLINMILILFVIVPFTKELLRAFYNKK